MKRIISIFKKNANFRTIAAVNFINRLGDSAETIAYTYILYVLTGSATVSALGLCINFLPTVLLQPLVGPFVEKYNAKKIMLLTDFLRGGFVLCLLTAYVSNHFSYILLLVFSFLISTVECFRVPAGVSVIPYICREEEYEIQASANTIFSTAATIAGTAVGALLLEHFGFVVILGLDAISFFASGVILIFLKVSVQKAEQENQNYATSLKEGFALFIKDNALRIITLLVIVNNLLSVPFAALEAPIVTEMLGGGADLLSVTSVSTTLGILAGSVLFPWIMKHMKDKRIIRLSLFSYACFYAIIFVLPYIPVYWLVSIILFVVNFLLAFITIWLSLWIQSRFITVVDKDKIGRCAAIFNSISAMCMPLFSFFISICVLKISTKAVVLTTAALALLITVISCVPFHAVANFFKYDKIKKKRRKPMLPALFLDRMKMLLKEDYPAFLKSFEEENHRALRVNTRKINVEEFLEKNPFSLKKVPWTENGFYYEEEEKPGKHPYHEAGVYYIQEPSAMAPVTFLDAKPGERILDLCAAPGGKTTQIADFMENKGILISNEIHAGRAKILSENVERMGISNAIVTNETPAHLAEFFPGYFDRILVDAPCSGEGMFRKNEEACGEWSPENVALCAERQDECLSCAAKMLRPGGTIVYATCTFAPLENEGSISRFLKAHPDFSVAKVTRPEGFLPGQPSWIEEPADGIENCMRLMPHLVDGEGHFLAVLKKEEAGEVQFLRDSKNGTEKSIAKKDCKEWLAFKEEALQNFTKEGTYLKFGDQLYLGPKDMPALKGLKVLRPGLHLGTFKKNRFEPSHALALALKAEEAKQAVTVLADSLEIRQYLGGQTLVRDNTEEKGWCLVCVDGFSIGWGKLAGGILKNHYPKGLRKR